jgi:hypothetical protein
MENLPGVIPDAALVEKASRAGLRTREVCRFGLPAVLCRGQNPEAALSLTVAGAVQALHLIPVHLASEAMIRHEGIHAKTRVTS